jgi:flagellar biosynthesis protein FliR
VLSLGFPIRILVGLIVIIAALPVTLSVSESFTNEVVDTIIAWSTTSAGPGGGA